MPYAIAVMRALVQGYGVSVDCIYWDENKRTPFIPVNESGITFHKRSTFDEVKIKTFIRDRNPSIIYIAGRMDKLYLGAALHFKHSSIIVSGCDNQWTGSLKQRIAALFSRHLYRRYFQYVWVPGKRQHLYAKKMGYADKNIIPNLLTADTAVFGTVYHENKQLKREHYPHTIVYAGRFAKSKGVDILIAAFKEAKKETQNNWQLILVGAGDVPVANEPFIKISGFMQANELASESRYWGVFCLPSRYEPWGVVIHEFAMVGLPIICTDSAGAADELVMNNENGSIFKSGDKNSLKEAILTMMSKGDDELLLMGEKSYELSKKQSMEIAAQSLMNAIAKNKLT